MKGIRKMAIIKNAELWFPRLSPNHPSMRFSKTNPQWEVQLRTSNKDVKNEWKALGLKVVSVVPDDDPTQMYFRVNLNKKKFKADGSEAKHVEVIDGKRQPIDPNSIGNGSIGNVRVFVRDYTKPDGTEGKSFVLMAVQVVKHIIYIGEHEDFDVEDTEIIVPEGMELNDSDDEPKEPVNPKNQRPEDTF
jgi:hypothetical protein